MVNTILILAMVRISLNLLFKPKNNVLGCGLFGAVSDDVTRINIDKLKILGIYNDIRGGHSCGISIDGDIIAGVNDEKLFKNFIAENDIIAPNYLPVVLGHTRMATGGAHTIDNAHPFGFGDNKGSYKFIGAHNGTLHNHIELATKYDIDTNVKTGIDKNGKDTFRNKIDSEVLLEIIYNKGFKILEEYEGAAALTMYDTTKPDTFYLYHGMSKKIASDKEAVEERPMFVYQHSKGLLYYSSLENSLRAINDNDGEIIELEHNYVYEIKNGTLKGSKRYKIDRSEKLQTKYSTPTTTTTYSNGNYKNSKHHTWRYDFKEWMTDYEYNQRLGLEKSRKEREDKLMGNTSSAGTNSTVRQLPSRTWNLNSLQDHKEHFELFKPELLKNVYYENLRFYKEKKELDGIYAVTKTMDLYYLCSLTTSIDEYYETSKKGASGDTLFKEPLLMYFSKGICLINQASYIEVKGFTTMSTIDLSIHSKYPIKDAFVQTGLIFFKGSVANLKFNTFIGLNTITIANGKCISIDKKDVDFEKNKKFYLTTDISFFEQYASAVAKNIKLEVAEKNGENIKENIIEVKSNDETAVELYRENLIATADYCVDDTDDSIEDVATSNKVKTKLENIKEFITKTLSL